MKFLLILDQLQLQKYPGTSHTSTMNFKDISSIGFDNISQKVLKTVYQSLQFH